MYACAYIYICLYIDTCIIIDQKSKNIHKDTHTYRGIYYTYMYIM